MPNVRDGGTQTKCKEGTPSVELVFETSYGERAHLRPSCAGLRSRTAQLRSKPFCAYCAPGVQVAGPPCAEL